MALRTFMDRDGREWSAWFVRPTTGDASPLPSRYRDGWICFERMDGSGRCRMPLDQVPPGWESLPDERLDLLRRVAEQAVHTGVRPHAAVDGGQDRSGDDRRSSG